MSHVNAKEEVKKEPLKLPANLDPQQWSFSKKMRVLCGLCVPVLALTYTSSSYVSSLAYLMEQYEASRVVIVAGVSLFVLGFGVRRDCVVHDHAKDSCIDWTPNLRTYFRSRWKTSGLPRHLPLLYGILFWCCLCTQHHFPPLVSILLRIVRFLITQQCAGIHRRCTTIFVPCRC